MLCNTRQYSLILSNLEILKTLMTELMSNMVLRDASASKKQSFHKYFPDCLEPAGCGACAFSYSRVCPPTKFWHKYLFIFPQIFAPPLTNIFGDFWHKFAPSTLKCSIYHKWLCRDIPHQLSYFRVWLLFLATLLVGQCWSSSHEAITWIMGSLLWSELGIATHISSTKVAS